MIPREQILEKAKAVFRSYGFAPIDTPALEYANILLGKGGEESDRLVYRFKDHGDRDVALRFDLTVPFARFAAEHIGDLGTPFKRYHMGPVWRGENTAHGRYREFWQCDFDTIGTASNAADIEIVLVIFDLFTALGMDGFVIHVNNRMVLNGLLEDLGLGQRSVPLLRALDKLPKAGTQAVRQEMTSKVDVSAADADRILSQVQMRGTNEEILDRLESDFAANPQTAEGIRHLRELCTVVKAAGVPEGKVVLDLAIARGLDYYTGSVFETFLTDLPGIGSVCSGGRYDNLAALYSKQQLPGVGASLGVDRFLAALDELKLLPQVSTPAPVLIVQFSADRLGDYNAMARHLRRAGIGVEVFTDPKKVGQQLQYAEKRGFRLALIAGPDEFTRGQWKIKDLARRHEISVAASEVVLSVEKLLNA
jgi:histidyl-tRNA synthetase